MKKVLTLLLLSVLASLAGCSATTNFEAIQPDVSLRVNDQPKFNITNSNEQRYKTTSFGQYKFKAERAGIEPMYGLIPLKFNGGYLAADILFFAPGTFFNLREVFPFYQFDVEKREVRYKKHDSDDWIIYRPKPEEVEHAKLFFGEQVN